MAMLGFGLIWSVSQQKKVGEMVSALCTVSNASLAKLSCTGCEAPESRRADSYCTPGISDKTYTCYNVHLAVQFDGYSATTLMPSTILKNCKQCYEYTKASGVRDSYLPPRTTACHYSKDDPTATVVLVKSDTEYTMIMIIMIVLLIPSCCCAIAILYYCVKEFVDCSSTSSSWTPQHDLDPNKIWTPQQAAAADVELA